MRLIEDHSDELALGLTEQLRGIAGVMIAHLGAGTVHDLDGGYFLSIGAERKGCPDHQEYKNQPRVLDQVSPSRLASQRQKTELHSSHAPVSELDGICGGSLII
jgi:hypothetical protein